MPVPQNNLTGAHTPVARTDANVANNVTNQPMAAGSQGIITQPAGAGQRPKSIREYLDLMRQVGETPRFTNIPGQQEATMAGEQFQPGSFFMPEPKQPESIGNQRIINNPFADPLVRAKEMVSADMDDIWYMATGKRPGELAEPEDYQRFQEAVKERHQLYAELADEQAKRIDDLLKEFTGESVFKYILTGDPRGLMKVAKDIDQNWTKIYQRQYNEVYKQLAGDALNPIAPEEAAAQAHQSAVMFIERLREFLGEKVEESAHLIPEAPGAFGGGRMATPPQMTGSGVGEGGGDGVIPSPGVPATATKQAEARPADTGGLDDVLNSPVGQEYLNLFKELEKEFGLRTRDEIERRIIAGEIDEKKYPNLMKLRESLV